MRRAVSLPFLLPYARGGTRVGARIGALVAALLLQAPSVGAEEMIVAMRVNGEARGDVLIDTQPDGSFHLNAQDAAKLNFTAERLSAITTKQNVTVLASREQLTVKLNTDALTLDVAAAADWFARSVISLSTRSRVSTSQLEQWHGWFNYSLAMQAAKAVRPGATLETSATVSHGAWTARSNQNAVFATASTAFTRTLSNLAYDDAARLTRLSFGDVTPAAGMGTTATKLIGVQWARHFEFDPAVSTQPTFNWSGQVRTPSTVDVFVDGTRAKTFTLAPGPFDLRDLAYFSGLRNVEIVIRDRAGVETRLQVPYYFATELLAAGKDSFDLSVGASDTGSGARPWVLSASYRKGLTDNITLGAGAQAKAAYQSARVDLAGRHEALGTLFLAAAVSRSRDERVRGAATLSHNWSSGRVSTQVGGSWQQRGFGIDPDGGASTRALLHQVSASGSYSFDQQRSASVNFSRAAFTSGAPERVLSLRLAQGWGRGVSAWLSVSQLERDYTRATAVAIGFSSPLGPNWSTSSGYSSQSGEGFTISTRAMRRNSDDAGDGWSDVRLAAEHHRGSTTVEGFAQRAMALGVAAVSARAEQGNATRELSAELRFSGALTWADQQFWWSPPIAQAFAIVSAAGNPGVRVMHNNQLVGRTNAEGKLLLPNLAAYAANQVRIDDRDIPMEVELNAVQQDVVPRMNAGTSAKFSGKRVSAVGGVFQLTQAPSSELIVLAAAQVTASNGAESVVSSTDGDGGFYLENLAPGRWAVSVLARKARCSAVITIADNSPAFIDLGRIPCTSP